MKDTVHPQAKNCFDCVEGRDGFQTIIDSYNKFVPRTFFSLLGKDHIIDVGLGDQTEKVLTILFSDIRDFTTLSEAMTPFETFSFINSYLRVMEPLIRKHHGFIDKFIGDGIMALFPRRADDALDSAIAMVNQLQDYNRGRARAKYEPVDVGIGINSGFAILGTVGGSERMEGTVIGDAVNLSSRVAATTKQYGVRILISEHTYDRLTNPDRYDVRFIDRIFVKGKKQPQSIYEVFTADPIELKEAKMSMLKSFEEALAYYHYKKIRHAQKLLDQCLHMAPDDKPAQAYREKCRKYRRGIHEGAYELKQLLKWGPEYEIGNRLIDAQHRELFSIIKKLLYMIEHDKFEKIDDIVGFLGDYVSKHFTDEESIMLAVNYPFSTLQRAQHHRFMVSFANLKKELARVSTEKIYVTFRVQILVVDWLLNHTTKSDMHFGKFLKNNQSLPTSATA